MPLSAGTFVGPYEILSALGAGGMGEVYRATDTKLKRQVAVKILPSALAADPDRLARFQREAEVLASLNHPHIAAIYGLEDADGNKALVMELVEGDDLSQRIARGLISADEALPIAGQIADALEAAHEQGIIHRDLKPGNIKVRPDGTVKVLDFGLAKLTAGEGAGRAGRDDLSQSPTLTSPAAMTGMGVILGTASYMSPEQARGGPVDKRTDVWAFGAVLYEMLTGRPAFPGETTSDTIAAVLGREPDWQALPAATPVKIRDLLRRCLQKAPGRRLRDVGDARLEIEETLAQMGSIPMAPILLAPQRSLWRQALPWGLVILTAVGASVSLWRARQTTPLPAQAVKRFVIATPVVNPLGLVGTPNSSTIVLSPDGSRLVYVAKNGSNTQLHMRVMARVAAAPIRGTDGAVASFFSPDGRQIGFFADAKLKKIDLASGDVVTLCESRWAWGGSWGPDDSIFFTPGSATGIWKVSAQGGKPQVLIAPDYGKGERSYRFPEVLPGGKGALYTIISGGGSSPPEARIAMLHLATGKRQVLVEAGSNAHYVPTGHLVYARGGALLAVPFDLERLAVTGSPVEVVENLFTDAVTAAAQVSLSSDGTLAYVPGGTQVGRRNVVWVDRKGAARPVTETPRAYGHLSLSPDGRQVAAGIAEAGNTDVWVLNIARGTQTRLTSDVGIDHMPIWTPDGKRVTFGSNRAGAMDIYWTLADGSEPEIALLTAPLAQWPTSWSPDGRRLAYTEEDPTTGFDIWVLTLQRERRPFLQTPFDERTASFSPDGSWLAYVSNESSRDEIYVRPYSGTGQKFQISTEGGTEPVWARSGLELFYRNGDRMMSVAVSTNPTFRAEKPKLLFEGGYERAGPFTSYDVAADGQRFAMIRSEAQLAPSPITVVLNWFEELKARVPTK